MAFFVRGVEGVVSMGWPQWNPKVRVSRKLVTSSSNCKVHA